VVLGESEEPKFEHLPISGKYENTTPWIEPIEPATAIWRFGRRTEWRFDEVSERHGTQRSTKGNHEMKTKLRTSADWQSYFLQLQIREIA
jgi:hypothetical protein